MQEIQNSINSKYKRFIEHAIGPGTYEIIDEMLFLFGFDNWNILNLKDYVYKELFGDFKISNDTNIHFQFYENDIHCTLYITSLEGKAVIEFDDKFNVIYTDYREMLENNSLLHFEYFKSGQKITEFFNSDICKLGQINIDSKLNELESNGFLPSNIEYKSKLIGGYNNKKFLENIKLLQVLKDSLALNDGKKNVK